MMDSKKVILSLGEFLNCLQVMMRKMGLCPMTSIFHWIFLLNNEDEVEGEARISHWSIFNLKN